MLYDTRKRKRKFFCVSVALLWPRSRRKFFYGPISFVGYITCDCHVPPCVCLDVQQNSAIQLFFLFVPSVPFFSFIAILCIVYLSPEIYVYDRITPELCGRVMRVATFFLFLILTDAIFFSFYFFLDIFCVSWRWILLAVIRFNPAGDKKTKRYLGLFLTFLRFRS